MSVINDLSHIPPFQTFIDTISILDLPISASALHGIMCGYLCAGAVSGGETYLRSLTPKAKDKTIRDATLAIFAVYAISHQQLINFNFEFQMMLPDEHESLRSRAQAFGEWCEGFVQGLTNAGVSFEQLEEGESQDALQHLLQFAELEYEALEVDEEDEKALMEVSEYARMAVLRLYGDLLSDNEKHGSSKTKH